MYSTIDLLLGGLQQAAQGVCHLLVHLTGLDHQRHPLDRLVALVDQLADLVQQAVRCFPDVHAPTTLLTAYITNTTVRGSKVSADASSPSLTPAPRSRCA